jgi:osmoprotectant transport system ATP-binding protein
MNRIRFLMVGFTLIMLTFEGLSKRYGEVPVLKDVSLALAEGLTHVLLGSSGAGKSTLLRLIMGLETPDSGRVLVGGLEVCERNRPELVHRLGYVGQNGGLFPHLTARQNIELVARKEKWLPPRTRERLREVAELASMPEGILDRFPKELSGGQQQRVGLMRALFLNPPYLLLDEPLGALDPIVRYALQNELKEIFNRLKKTVLIVTHDLAEASFFGHSITLLHHGSVLQHGSFRELLTHPASPHVSQFIHAQRPIEGIEE